MVASWCLLEVEVWLSVGGTSVRDWVDDSRR